MPAMKLNVRPVTSSHAPQTINDARCASVRGALPRNTSPVTSSNNAAGMSQAIWPPWEASNMRRMPVSPHIDPPPPPTPPGVTLPVSLPLSRPNPL